MNHAETFFAAAAQICHDISFASIEALASELDRLRDRRGRLFLIGVFTVLAFAAAVAGWLASHSAQLIVSWDDGEIATSLAFGFAVVAALVAVLLMLTWSISYLGALPKQMSRRRAEERHRRGFNALTQGLLAVAAGDAKAAGRHAREANELLSEPALTLLLGEQAAQLGGDARAAEERFTEMLASKETEFLGLRGLFIQASRRGDRSVALAYLRKAAEIRPGTPAGGYTKWKSAAFRLALATFFRVIEFSESTVMTTSWPTWAA